MSRGRSKPGASVQALSDYLWQTLVHHSTTLGTVGYHDYLDKKYVDVGELNSFHSKNGAILASTKSHGDTCSGDASAPEGVKTAIRNARAKASTVLEVCCRLST